MRTHQDIDRRSLELARAIVAIIDADPERRGLAHAREVCRRWLASQPSPAVEEWGRLLSREWPDIRALLLDEGDEGQRLRQNDPFCGILTPQQRWAIYRKFRDSSGA